MSDIAVVNAWLLYRHLQLKNITNYQPLVDFKADIAKALIKYGKQQKRGRPSSDDATQNVKKKAVKP